MNRGLSHVEVFVEDRDREQFFSLIGELTRLWGLKVHAYCLMDTHYHLLLQTSKAELSRAMRHLDGIYTLKFNRVHGRDGPLFRGRYKAILIDVEEYFSAVARYIHRNPVDAGVVRDIGEYKWSSHRGYLDRRKSPDWLDTETLLARFGKGRRGVKEYEAFMGCRVEKELREFYRETFQRPILGGKAFVEWVKKKIGQRAKVEEEKPQSRRVFGLGLQEIVGATARVYGKRIEELGKKRRGYENEARAMAMYLCRTLGGHKLTEIGKVLGLEKYSSVSSACLAMKGRIEREKRLARRVRTVERLLKSQQQT
jgi:REP element-mobilizing transposase RayT